MHQNADGMDEGTHWRRVNANHDNVNRKEWTDVCEQGLVFLIIPPVVLKGNEKREDSDVATL